MTIDVGAIDRSLGELTIGLLRDRDQRKATLAPDQLRETEQQIVVPIAGDAATTAVYVDVDVRFDMAFHPTTTQRDSTLVMPHFTFGFTALAGDPVAVVGMVKSWKVDGRRSVFGAVVTLGVHAPHFPPVAVPFRGEAHLKFQGWGAPFDVDEAHLADDHGSGGS